ncbi:Sel1 repeat protein [Thermoplasmatales archaeon BRNA1]|nr:Sel1 repeat protein [Thermoplasmatales archaeon BRNA1]
MDQDEITEIQQSFPEDKQLCQSYLRGLVGDVGSRWETVGNLIYGFKEERLAFLVCKQFSEFGKGGYEHWMGLMYEKGIGTEQDPHVAIEWYWLGASIGDPECQYEIGYAGISGLFPNSISQSEGIRMMAASADRGYHKALSFMGMMYAVGLGVERDPQKAFSYYCKASEAGSDTGIQNVAFCYQHGFGVTQDIRKAMKMYQGLADKGDVEMKISVIECRRMLDEQMHLYV